MGTLLRCHLQQVLTVKDNLALGDLIGRMAYNHIAERALAGTVQSHDGMHLTVSDGQVDTF